MTVTDNMVTVAMAAYEGKATRVEAWRAALEAAMALQDAPEWEYVAVAEAIPEDRWPNVGATHIPTDLEGAQYTVRVNERDYGVKMRILRRPKPGEWEEVV